MIPGNAFRLLVTAVRAGPLAVPTVMGFSFSSAPMTGDDLLHELLALSVVIVATRVLGFAFRRLRQPLVVGEIVAGVVLGPSLLGWISPDAFAFLFPPAAISFLNAIARLGVILYMFLVGLEIDPLLLRRQSSATIALAQFGIVLPLILGVLVALPLYPQMSAAAVTPLHFYFFLGIVMAATAFPVLARILTDRRIHTTPIGAVALGSAALGDLTVWFLLAILLGLIEAESAGGLAAFTMIAGFLLLLVLLVYPAMRRLSVVYGNRGRLTQGVMATVFVALLMSALVAQTIGLHALIGAFALGAVIPHDSGMARELTDRFEDPVVVLLLPAFFAITGLRTELAALSPAQWLLCGAIIVVAWAGKFGASALAARLWGMGWRDASVLGVLMNTRGLIELIVLDIGFGLAIISPSLFTILVVMTLVTTFATTPVIDLIVPRAETEGEAAPATTINPALGPVRRAAIVVAISNPEGAAHLLDVALAANRPGDPPPHVVAMARRPAEGVRSGLREMEQRVAPQPPALVAALDYVHERGSAVTSQAVWTDDPATDILRAAKEAQCEWIMLGAHQSVFGSDFRGGVVRSITDRAESIPVRVAVVTPAPRQRLDRIFVVVDHSPHGRAALDLGIRLVKRTRRSLHVILVPRIDVKPDLPLLEMVRSVGRAEGLRLHTDVLAERSAAQLARQAPGPLVIIGTNLLDEFILPQSGLSGYSTIVVQGISSEPQVASSEPDRGAASSSKGG